MRGMEAEAARSAYLLDTNMLTRSAQPHSPEYAVATGAIAMLLRRNERLCVAPQNLIEFWSVATRPTGAPNGLGMSPTEADAEIQRIEATFELLPETPDIFLAWRHLVTSHSVSGRQVHDARSAAIMQVYGLPNILTFNAGDFARYGHVTVVDPRSIVTPATGENP